MARRTARRMGAAIVVVLALSACNSDDDQPGASVESIEPSNPSNPPSTTQPAPTTTASTPSGSSVPGSSVPSGAPVGSPTSVFESGDIDHGLDPYIRRATDDLAARLAIDASAITTVSAVIVVWPDAGLGCNDPKKSYAQVATDGSVIELEAAGTVYRYHTGGPELPFLCERPLRSTPTRA